MDEEFVVAVATGDGAGQPVAHRQAERGARVAQALLDNLPELREVQEIAPDAAPTTTFIPVSSIGIGRPAPR